MEPAKPILDMFYNGYLTVNLTNLVEVRQALEIFGGVYTALALPTFIQNEMSTGVLWDVKSGPDGIPGSLGGHMVISRSCDFTQPKGIINIITWGAQQQMTEAFWLKYCSAAYFFITPEWIAANGLTPSGVNLQAMLDDVRELTSN